MRIKLGLGLIFAVLVPAAQAWGACTTTTTVRKAGGGTCTGIQQCVDAVGALAGDYCINVDSATYSEQVTIQGKATNGFRLIIQTDPSLVSTVTTVSPPALSTAAFWVLNDSVTIQNIRVVTTNTVDYGVWSSSSHITLSSVNIDSGGNIGVAALSLSSFSSVSYSSVTAEAAAGVTLDGSSSTITMSTFTTTGSWKHAVYVNGPYCTLTRSFASSASGNAVHVLSHDTTVSLSTAASGSGAGIAVASSSNTISRNYFAGYTGISLEGGGNIVALSTAIGSGNGGYGMFIDGSSNTVSSCTLSNPNAFGLSIGGAASAYNNIDRSTITTNTGSAAISVGGAFTTLSRVYASNPNGGPALQLNSGADFNTIDLSTFTGVSISRTLNVASSSNSITRSFISNISQNALFVGGSYNAFSLSSIYTTNNLAADINGSYNSFTDCTVSNPAGDAFRITGLANSIHRSTITTTSALAPGLGIYNSGLNSVTNSYVQGRPAVFTSGPDTVVNSNILVATNSAAYGLSAGGVANLTASSNTFILGPQSGGVLLQSMSGTIVISTSIFKGGRYGVYADNLDPAASVWITSNTIVPAFSTTEDTFGFYFNGLINGATVSNNSVVFRGPGSMGAFTAYGLYAQNSAGLVIDHNRFSNPGLITAGSFGGVTLSNTPNSSIKFNDVHSTGTALADGFLLQILAGSTGAAVKDNVFSSSMAVTGSSATVKVSADSQAGFVSDYNDFFSSNSLNAFLWGAAAYDSLAAWQAVSAQDYHSWAVHPLWNDPAAEDFHPLSALGRYDPLTRTFVADAVTAGTVNAGDSAESFALEPAVNGGVVNQGSYGNTPEASKGAAPAAVNPPLASAIVAVTSDTVSLVWLPNGNRNPGTDWEVWHDVSPGFGAPTLVVVATAAHTALSLATNTTFYFRVRGRNAAGVATTFDAAVSTKTLSVPAAPGIPAGVVLGVSSISWTWAAAAGAASYDVYPASEPATRIATPVAPAFTAVGLSTNTAYRIIVAGEGPNGRGPLATSATAYTMAMPPTGTASPAVDASSAVITWSLNTNPAETTAQLQRSTDGLAFQTVFSSMDATYTDVNLIGCTSYYYRVRNLNGDGIATAFDGTINFLTQNSTPLPPGSFTAAALAGNRIALSWALSPTEGITQYRLYFDNGAGAVSYAAPLAVLASTETSYTTGILTSSAAYRFGLRAVHRCGMEDPSTSAQTSAASLAALTGIRTALSAPHSGQRVRGNRVTLLAEQTLGSASALASVRFQYRPSNTAAWVSVTGAGSRANPVSSPPYFVHWDPSALAPGDYDLRAVASDLDAVADSFPPSVTVAVLDPADPSFDVDEIVSGVGTRKRQLVSAGGSSAVLTADAARPSTLKIILPAGALDTPTATLTALTNPTLPASPPAGSETAGAAAEITLDNGQTALAGGQKAALTFSYADADADGIVDNTTLRADRLALYAYNAVSGQWTREFASTLDAQNHTITGLTPHFSFFAVFGAPAAADLSALRVYPNPYKPHSGNPDEGLPFSAGDQNSGIIFDNLPAEASIRIYAVTGQLVARMSSSATAGKLRWDVRDDSGRSAASGRYFAVISSPGRQSVTKQLMVIR